MTTPKRTTAAGGASPSSAGLDDEFTEHGLKAFEVDDYGSTFVAADKAEALAGAFAEWGPEDPQCPYFPDGEEHAMMMRLDESFVLDPGENEENDPLIKRTYREEIKRRLAEGAVAPFFLCGRDT